MKPRNDGDKANPNLANTSESKKEAKIQPAYQKQFKALLDRYNKLKREMDTITLRLVAISYRGSNRPKNIDQSAEFILNQPIITVISTNPSSSVTKNIKSLKLILQNDRVYEGVEKQEIADKFKEIASACDEWEKMLPLYHQRIKEEVPDPAKLIGEAKAAWGQAEATQRFYEQDSVIKKPARSYRLQVKVLEAIQKQAPVDIALLTAENQKLKLEYDALILMDREKSDAEKNKIDKQALTEEQKKIEEHNRTEHRNKVQALAKAIEANANKISTHQSSLMKVASAIESLKKAYNARVAVKKTLFFKGSIGKTAEHKKFISDSNEARNVILQTLRDFNDSQAKLLWDEAFIETVSLEIPKKTSTSQPAQTAVREVVAPKTTVPSKTDKKLQTTSVIMSAIHKDPVEVLRPSQGGGSPYYVMIPLSAAATYFTRNYTDATHATGTQVTSTLQATQPDVALAENKAIAIINPIKKQDVEKPTDGAILTRQGNTTRLETFEDPSASVAIMLAAQLKPYCKSSTDAKILRDRIQLVLDEYRSQNPPQFLTQDNLHNLLRVLQRDSQFNLQVPRSELSIAQFFGKKKTFAERVYNKIQWDPNLFIWVKTCIDAIAANQKAHASDPKAFKFDSSRLRIEKMGDNPLLAKAFLIYIVAHGGADPAHSVTQDEIDKMKDILADQPKHKENKEIHQKMFPTPTVKKDVAAEKTFLNAFELQVQGIDVIATQRLDLSARKLVIDRLKRDLDRAKQWGATPALIAKAEKKLQNLADVAPPPENSQKHNRMKPK